MGKAEAYVEDYLVDEAARRGWLALKFTTPSVTGVPDRLVITPHGRFLVETKSAVGSLSARQRYMRRQFEKAGSTFYVAKTHERVNELLDNIAKLPITTEQEMLL